MLSGREILPSSLFTDFDWTLALTHLLNQENDFFYVLRIWVSVFDFQGAKNQDFHKQMLIDNGFCVLSFLRHLGRIEGTESVEEFVQFDLWKVVWEYAKVPTEFVELLKSD